MQVLRFTVAATHTLAFAAMLVMAGRAAKREPSSRIRAIWTAVAVTAAALVLSGVQKLMFQASLFGWGSPRTSEFLQSDWHLLQSVMLWGLAAFAFLTIRQATQALAVAERIAGKMVDRLDPGVDLELLPLTPREREVLNLIGDGKVTDAELADELFVAESTVQSHIKSLLRKTGVPRRSDLVALANTRRRR